MAIGVAFKAFFAALLNAGAAERIQTALSETESTTQSARIEEQQKPNEVQSPVRSDALTLLSTLQREGRLLDLVYESLDGFDDAQVGAAAREVINECRKAIDRMFAMEPLSDEDEGATIEIPEHASPNRLRLIGGDRGRGTVTHRGWKATRCELPNWAGKREEAWLLAPTEVEIG